MIVDSSWAFGWEFAPHCGDRRWLALSSQGQDTASTASRRLQARIERVEVEALGRASVIATSGGKVDFATIAPLSTRSGNG